MPLCLESQESTAPIGSWVAELCGMLNCRLLTFSTFCLGASVYPMASLSKRQCLHRFPARLTVLMGKKHWNRKQGEANFLLELRVQRDSWIGFLGKINVVRDLETTNQMYKSWIYSDGNAISLTLRHFKRQDSVKLGLFEHFSKGATFLMIQAKVLFADYKWSDNCLKSLLHEIKITWLFNAAKEKLEFVAYVSKPYRLRTVIEN